MPTLPTYQCHKRVQAMKIRRILRDLDRWLLAGELDLTTEADIPTVQVSPEWMQKHKPHVGGYYVRYEDGYESFSPAAPFEEGYTLANGSGPRLIPFDRQYDDAGISRDQHLEAPVGRSR